jgi:hypothetical protein
MSEVSESMSVYDKVSAFADAIVAEKGTAYAAGYFSSMVGSVINSLPEERIKEWLDSIAARQALLELAKVAA